MNIFLFVAIKNERAIYFAVVCPPEEFARSHQTDSIEREHSVFADLEEPTLRKLGNY
jgi:hypothetical protein